MKFDEFTIGQTFQTKSFEVTKEDIIRFSEEFDPQYMHLDEEKAAEGMFGGIIASGLHTLSLSFRNWIDEGVYGEDVIAGRNLNNIKFRKPVFPGDVLFAKAEVIDKKAANKDSGLVTIRLVTYNQQNEKVLTVDMSALMKR